MIWRLRKTSKVTSGLDQHKQWTVSIQSEDKNISNYDESEGLQSNEFYWGGSHNNRDGFMLFGGESGLHSFIPKEIKDKDVIPPIVITDF